MIRSATSKALSGVGSARGAASWSTWSITSFTFPTRGRRPCTGAMNDGSTTGLNSTIRVSAASSPCAPQRSVRRCGREGAPGVRDGRRSGPGIRQAVEVGGELFHGADRVVCACLAPLRPRFLASHRPSQKGGQLRSNSRGRQRPVRSRGWLVDPEHADATCEQIGVLQAPGECVARQSVVQTVGLSRNVSPLEGGDQHPHQTARAQAAKFRSRRAGPRQRRRIVLAKRWQLRVGSGRP